MSRITNDQISTILAELNSHDPNLEYTWKQNSYGWYELSLNGRFVTSTPNKADFYQKLVTINHLRHVDRQIEYSRMSDQDKLAYDRMSLDY